MYGALLKQLGFPAEVYRLHASSLLTLGSVQRPYINQLLTQFGMAVDKISVNDPRVQHKYSEVVGNRWHYLDAVPQGQQKGVVFLIHGFPDISLAWRYQIPMLLSLGFRCIALDCLGYGRTDAPQVPPASIHEYGFKHHADAIAAIAKEIGASRIILGGHDWGGAVVYRVAQWQPELVSHVFSVATPYFAVSDTFVPTEELVKGPVKQFGYQLQFASDVIEKSFDTKEKISKFLLALYGGKPSERKPALTPEKGVDIDLLLNGDVGPSPFFTQEEIDYYVSEFTRNGLHGPTRWYATREANFEDEKSLPAEQRKGVQQPTLFVQADHDNILKPEMSRGMEKSVPNLTRGSVPASHWALWHTPQETNEVIKGWFENVVLGGRSKI